MLLQLVNTAGAAFFACSRYDDTFVCQAKNKALEQPDQSSVVRVCANPLGRPTATWGWLGREGRAGQEKLKAALMKRRLLLI